MGFVSSLFLLVSLILLRVLNSATTLTFVQPDEYWQSLEPAHVAVYGFGYLTWEWRLGLRSSAHPLLFALFYKLLDSPYVPEIAKTSPDAIAWVPGLVQAVIAALADFHFVRFAHTMFRNKYPKSTITFYSVAVTVGSAYNWFMATRTFSNSLEMALTTIALAYWPWRPHSISAFSYLISLVVGATSCSLRPTNFLIWIFLGSILFFKTNRKFFVLALAVIIVSSILVTSQILDQWYYSNQDPDHTSLETIKIYGDFELIVPVWNFIKFNFVEDVAPFYGTSPWHYYIVQGIPLLLATYIPFTLYDMVKSKSSHSTLLVVFVIVVFSLLKHKEARFIYPVLPILHLKTLNAFLRHQASKKLLSVLIFINLALGGFFNVFHQRGVNEVITYLRNNGYYTGSPDDPSDASPVPVTSVGFLMPCHSTPWQSHLHRSDLKSWSSLWFLTCEPPIGLNEEERENYLDVCDRFYADPESFLKEKFPPLNTIQGSGGSLHKRDEFYEEQPIILVENVAAIQRKLEEDHDMIQQYVPEDHSIFEQLFMDSIPEHIRDKVTGAIDKITETAEEAAIEPAEEKISESPERQIIESANEQSTESIKEQTTESIKEQTTELVKEQPTEPIKEQTTEPVKEQTTESIKEQTTESFKEQTTEPIKEQPTEPIKEQSTEPGKEQIIESTKEKVTGSAEEQTFEHLQEQIKEPVSEQVVESTTESLAKPFEEQTIESVKEKLVDSIQEKATQAVNDPVNEKLSQPIFQDKVSPLVKEKLVEPIKEQVEDVKEKIVEPVEEKIVESVVEKATDPTKQPVVENLQAEATDIIEEKIAEPVKEQYGDLSTSQIPEVKSVFEPVVEHLTHAKAVEEKKLQSEDLSVKETKVETPINVKVKEIISEAIENAGSFVESLKDELIHTTNTKEEISSRTIAEYTKTPSAIEKVQTVQPEPIKETLETPVEIPSHTTQDINLQQPTQHSQQVKVPPVASRNHDVISETAEQKVPTPAPIPVPAPQSHTPSQPPSRKPEQPIEAVKHSQEERIPQPDHAGEYEFTWPSHLVFFEALESVIGPLLKDTPYKECKRFFNTYFHDDPRRRGDVIVYCK